MEAFSALLLCTDSGAMGIVHKTLEEYGVSSRIVDSIPAANQSIKTTKFDLGVYDSDIPGALELAAGRSPIANPKMIFALVRTTTLHEVAGKRIQFIVQKPFTADLFARSLRAAYGTMLRERRISFRHAVQIKPDSVMLVQEQGRQRLHECTVLDLSQTGMCIQTLEILPQGVNLEIEFQLPEHRERIHVSGHVMWTRASGRTGVKFGHIEPSEHRMLITWLETMMPFQVDAIPKPAPPMRQERLLEIQI
jgi:hypothetical protein